MRRLNRIASIPAGIFGLILTVPLTLAFIASMRELREMIEYLEKPRLRRCGVPSRLRLQLLRQSGDRVV